MSKLNLPATAATNKYAQAGEGIRRQAQKTTTFDVATHNNSSLLMQLQLHRITSNHSNQLELNGDDQEAPDHPVSLRSWLFKREGGGQAKQRSTVAKYDKDHHGDHDWMDRWR